MVLGEGEKGEKKKKQHKNARKSLGGTMWNDWEDKNVATVHCVPASFSLFKNP